MKRSSDIQITDEYKQVKRLVEAGVPIVFVTGKAGTGKSTLIRYLRDTLSGNCVVLAPTGVAAMNVQGATIHSFFRLPPRMLTDADVKPARFKKPYKKIDLLILDEISMVRADVLDAVDRFLRINGPSKHVPFGGVPVLMVGDLHQLPPVVSGTEEAERFNSEYETPFFFSSRVLASAGLTAVELTNVFRQQDDHFVRILNDVRLGVTTDRVLGELNTRVTPRADTNHETVLSTTNFIADRMNRRQLAALPSDRRSYHGTVEGEFQVGKDRFPSPLELMLKKDARVMFTKNDADGRWVNGSLGVVEKMTDKAVRVRLDESAETVDVAPTTWETYRYEYDDDADAHIPIAAGAYTQLPLTPAWAITIHKSQGKTLSAARIDLGQRAFAPGQVYVALSRCRRLRDVTLSRPISRNDVFCDPRVSRFYASALNAGQLDPTG